MPAITFPNDPNTIPGVGGQHVAENNLIYVWDGEKWESLGTNNADPNNFVQVRGDNMTGALTIGPEGGTALTTLGDDGSAIFEGNVGIGTSNTDQRLNIISPSGDCFIKMQASTGSVSGLNAIGSNTLAFQIGFEEKMRIDSSGRMIVGTNTLGALGTVNAYSNSTVPGLRAVGGSSMSTGSAALAVDKHANINTTSQVFMIFTINVQNTGSGQINANGPSQAAFGSFSDRRLKRNIFDLPPQLEKICRLRPVEFDYVRSEGGGHQTSFIAQEFEEVFPDAVGEREDGMKTLTGWGKTEAILVKALQEAVAKIESLESRLAALEADNAVLMGNNNGGS